MIDLFHQREAYYREVASHIIDTTEKNPEQIVQEIIKEVGDRN